MYHGGAGCSKLRVLRRKRISVRMKVLGIAVSLLWLPGVVWSQGAVPCAKMKGRRVEAAAIGLPTRGAVVTSAHEKAGFCEIKGEIGSIDPTAQGIRFEVNVPSNWNGKAVHYGGGGFDGALVTGLGRPEVGIKGEKTPLERGYATFGGDSGHHHHYLLLPDIYNELKARFALNDEQRLNFNHDGLKKTHDAAVAVIAQKAGTTPKRTFFLGGSTGGREAYFVTQRWPKDYDGVLGAFAGWNQVELDLQFIRVSEAEYRPGDKLTRGWLPKGKTRLVARRVMEACDALDGVKDGIISNPDACHFDLKTLACAPGKDGKECLTAGQLQTFETFATEQRSAEPLAHGVQTIPGYNVLAGADLTGSMGLFRHPFHPPMFPLGSFYYEVADGVTRFFLTKDPKFNALTLDTTTGGAYAKELMPQSIASDASDADLSEFAGHGGKFLIVHGTTDTTIPTGASVEFYKMMQERMGQAAVDGFARFYLVPGFGHGRGVFDAGFDALGVLDAWVESGSAPAALVVKDNNKGGQTRPLCRFPEWAKYKGGDVNMAGSFVCVQGS